MPVSSVERPVSALRQRMLEDMAMRGLRSHTQHDYVRFVRGFAAFLGRSPDTAQAEDIRRFQVHQREIGVQPPTINGSVSALRFLFTVTLDRPDLSRRLVLARFASGAECRGSWPAARSGTWAEVQGCSRHCLWCRVAGIRSGGPQDRRHRQHAHADPGRARQGTQGPQCHAVATAAGTAAALVARGQAARRHAAPGLVVSWAELSRTNFDAPNQPRGS